MGELSKSGVSLVCGLLSIVERGFANLARANMPTICAGCLGAAEDLVRVLGAFAPPPDTQTRSAGS
eukprot:6491476-Amphidinium_carterae.2